MTTFESVFFMFSGSKSFFFENTIAFPLKSCIINFKKYTKNLFFYIFFCNKTGFLVLRIFSNVNILPIGLLLQDWVFRLGLYLFFISLHLKKLNLPYFFIITHQVDWQDPNQSDFTDEQKYYNQEKGNKIKEKKQQPPKRKAAVTLIDTFLP